MEGSLHPVWRSRDGLEGSEICSWRFQGAVVVSICVLTGVSTGDELGMKWQMCEVEIQTLVVGCWLDDQCLQRPLRLGCVDPVWFLVVER